MWFSVTVEVYFIITYFLFLFHAASDDGSFAGRKGLLYGWFNRWNSHTCRFKGSFRDGERKLLPKCNTASYHFPFQASKISFASFEFFYSFRSLLWHGSLVPRLSIGSGCYSYTVVSGYEICGTVIPPTYDFNTIAEIALSSKVRLF